ncbi:MAG: ferric reductase-like transmembrane domain-containing protein [bacterium]|nr:ferric reductase-like transmembrane domain-containing protein [bacterium]
MQTKIKAKAIIAALLVFLAFSFIVFVNAVFNLGNLQNLEIALIFYLLGKLAGLSGFLFLSLLIFSGDTARYFDKFFGLDRIIKFQKKFALFTMWFVLAHPFFFILSDWSILSFLIPNFSALPLALGAMALYIFVIVMVASKMYKRISYNVWQYLHIFTYVLFCFSLYHAFYLGSDSNNWPVRAIYLILLAAVVSGAIYRTNYKLKQRRAGKFYVESVKYETKDVFTLTLKPKKKFLFKAGQFCFLRLNQDKLYARHPFTIASSPGEDELHFIIKIKGGFTKALLKLKPGDEVIVDGPFGIFTVDDHAKDLVFIAGGVGIAPFISLIRDKLAEETSRQVVLLYGAKTEAGIIYRQELDNIKQSWFKKVYILSDYRSGATVAGYINQEVIEKYVRNINNSLFYICGSESMKTSLKEILARLEVSRQNIIIEDFFW